ncbi:MAG: capsule assembly Wzi family protein [Candidatus Eisenbacteria bacterium]
MSAALLVAIAALPLPARATPYDLLRPGDPIYDELRVLDALGPGADSAYALPHLGTRPLQMMEIATRAPGRATADPEHTTRTRRIAEQRVARLLWFDGPDATRAGAPAGATPRLLQLAWPDGERLEVSAGIEATGRVAQDSLARWGSGSGLHVRAGAVTDHWLAYLHFLAGYVDSARTFADPIVPGNDVTTYTDEAYLAYTGTAGRWSIVLGRDRWSFGPGDEGTLMLSPTAAPYTALAMRARIPAIRADGIVINGTLQSAGGEQLAAHRLEWQPWEPLRIGLSEAARYRAASWQPLYLMGVIPYTVVQRLQVQDEPDSATTLRNNVMVGGDASWRVAPGTRFYGELLIDDLHARTASNPNKYGYQIGYDGAGDALGQRLTWGAEFTRISRYVYTSYFGRSFVAEGRPLGWPYGPDSRRFRLRAAWDASADWSVDAAAAWTDQGEAGLDSTFVPGRPEVDASKFLGVVTHTREAEIGLRWWPASGVTLEARTGYRWVDDAGHVSGATTQGAWGQAYVRLMR